MFMGVLDGREGPAASLLEALNRTFSRVIVPRTAELLTYEDDAETARWRRFRTRYEDLRDKLAAIDAADQQANRYERSPLPIYRKGSEVWSQVDSLLTDIPDARVRDVVMEYTQTASRGGESTWVTPALVAVGILAMGGVGYWLVMKKNRR